MNKLKLQLAIRERAYLLLFVAFIVGQVEWVLITRMHSILTVAMASLWPYLILSKLSRSLAHYCLRALSEQEEMSHESH